MFRRLAFDSLSGLAGIAAVLMLAMTGAVLFGGRVTAPIAAIANPIKTVKALVADPRRAPAHSRVIARAVSKPHMPPDAVAAAPLPPQDVAPDPALIAEQAGRVAQRIADKVPAALTPYFDTYIYVSKAAGGPLGQRLFLFHKNGDGTLAFEESFAVSTGRERSEQYFTATPTGIFELDVHRFFPMARSAKWDDARMPWAMFLNYSYREKMAGVALHAAIGAHELAMIGRRASGGCVRLPLAKANRLYHRFLSEARGQVPVLAFDDARGTTNVTGTVAQDEQGNILLADGLKVLVVIENYAGVAARPSQS